MQAMLRHSRLLADGLPRVSRNPRPVVLSLLCFGRWYSAGIHGETERVSHGTNSKNESEYEIANVENFAVEKAALLIGTSIENGIHIGIHSCAKPTRPQNSGNST